MEPYCLTLVAADGHAVADAPQAQAVLALGDVHALSEDGSALDVMLATTPDAASSTQALEGAPIDWCLQPQRTRRKALLVCDMDSTIIGQECIDELADMLGVKPQVAAITERAMRGELDFAASLRERVALLRGLPEARLEQVWQERIRVNPGAEALVRTMRAAGAGTLLISGGFTFFTSRVAQRVGFEVHHANVLLSEEGTLSGQVASPILDASAKARLMQEAAQARNLPAQATLAIGDGANDAAMIRAAGLGIAYRAKPALREVADASITHTDLRSALYFQGYHRREHAL